MTTATPTDITSDFTMVTSDSPEIIKRALEASGEKPADGESVVDDGKPADVAPVSGDGSDPSIEAGAEGSDDPNSDDSTDDSTDDNDDGDQTTGEQSKAKLKPRSGLDKRFAKLTTRIDEAQRQNAELLRQNGELLKQLQKPAAIAETKIEAAAVEVVEAFAPKPAPIESNFATFGEYITAQGKWVAEVVAEATTRAQKDAAKIVQESSKAIKAEFEAKSTKDKADFEAVRTAEAYQARAAKVAAEEPDWDKLVTKNPNNVAVTDVGKDVVMNHDLGPKVLLYLCRNPKEATRINALPANKQQIEYGIIIGKLSSSTATPASKSPNPKPKTIPPLPRGSAAGGRGTGGAMSNSRAANLPFDEYLAGRKAGTIR